MRDKATRGFTLVEILCVIVIIASLASILLPVFAGAKLSAYRTTCLGNLKQYGLVSGLYQADNDDYYPYGINKIEYLAKMPLGRPAGTDPSSFPLTVETVSGYLPDLRILRCPLDTGRAFLSGVRVKTVWGANGGSSYFCADLLVGQTSSTWSSPAASGYCTDAADNWHLGMRAEDFENLTYTQTTNLSRKNMLYYDMHVGVVKRIFICWEDSQCQP